MTLSFNEGGTMTHQQRCADPESARHHVAVDLPEAGVLHLVFVFGLLVALYGALRLVRLQALHSANVTNDM